MLNHLNHADVKRPRLWLPLLGGGLLMAGVALFGTQQGSREAVAQEGEKSADQIQDELRKALDSLKKGPDPVKEADKPADLNPVDEMRQAEEALRKAKKDLQNDPKSEAARKALEEATRKYQEAMKRARPNMQAFPIAPINPEDLDKEIARFNQELERMIEDMQRQMQMLPLQPGAFPGNRFFVGPNRFQARAMGEFRLGVRLEKPTPVLIDQLDLPADKSLVVASVMPNSPADKAGVKPNDILLEIGGKPVPTDAIELQRLMQSLKVDEKVDVVLMRKGKKETLKGISLPASRPEFQLQPMPRILIPNVGNPFPPEAFNGGRVSSVSVSVNNGEFTIRAAEEGTKYTIVGVRDDGGPKLTRVEIDEDGKITKAESLDKLEPGQRTAIERILRGVKIK
jgi:hypothetical protein